MINNNGLAEKTIDKIHNVFANYSEIEKATLYGSRATGNYKNGSDIDLTLEGDNLTDSLHNKIAKDLDNLLLPYTIDLSIFDFLNHAKLRDHIERLGVIFYDKTGNKKKTGWEVKTLGDVAKVSAGNSAPQDTQLFENGTYNFIRTADVGKIKVGQIDNSKDLLNDKGIKKLKLFPKGTVLFPKSGASTLLNHRVIMNIDGYVSSHLATIKADEKLVDNKYIFYILQTINAIDLIADSAYPSLQIQVIAKIQFLLPPLTTQKKIVTKLDKAFTAIDEALESAQQKRKEIALLKSSLLSAYLTPEDSAKKKGWETERIGDISLIIAGQSPKGENYNTNGKGIPFYQGKKNYGKKYFNTPAIWTNKITKEALADDILISVRAPVGAINILTSRICIGQGLALIRVGKRVINSYLYYFLSAIGKDIKGNPGATFNSITKNKIENIIIPLPPLKQQRTIIAKLDKIFAELEKVDTLTKTNQQNYIALKKAMLTKTMKP